jgi:hypothetical protein
VFSPADPQPDDGDVDFEAYMSFEGLAIAEEQDESSSSPPLLNPNEYDEEMTVAGLSSRHSTSTQHKHKSSTPKSSFRPKKAPSRKPSSPVQCPHEGCGEWFLRPTELQ